MESRTQNSLRELLVQERAELGERGEVGGLVGKQRYDHQRVRAAEKLAQLLR